MRMTADQAESFDATFRQSGAKCARCLRCGSIYVVPEAFSEKFEQARLTSWLAEHDCDALALGGAA